MRTDKPAPFHRLRDREKIAQHQRNALAEVGEGKPIKSVAERYGVSRQTIYDWKSNAEKNGGKVVRYPSARRVKLALDRQEEFKEFVRKGPREAGYEWDFWTLRRLVELVRDKFGVEYSLQGMSVLMRRLGFSVQKPERRARERNEKAIVEWVENILPEIEKKSG